MVRGSTDDTWILLGSGDARDGTRRRTAPVTRAGHTPWVFEFRAAEIGVEAARRLAAAPGVEIARGLRPDEFTAIEGLWGFRFADDHRAFLAGGLPVGPGWPDWRATDTHSLRNAVVWPIEGLLFDVEHNGFWHPEWAPRPEPMADALAVAHTALSRRPPLVPLHGTYYLPGGPEGCGHPVLDVFRSTVRPLGADLADWVELSFGTGPSGRDPKVTVPFWGDLTC